MSKKKENWQSESATASVRPFHIFICFMLLATHILIILNLRSYFLDQKNVKESQSEPEAASAKWPKPKMDLRRFEVEVVKPHKDMRAKFPKHPNLVIKKLARIVEKEQNKTSTLIKKINELKNKLGMNETEVKNSSAANRKLQSLDMEICPKESPYLLGPLIVRQDGIKELIPQSEEFNEHFSDTLQPGGAWKPSDCRARTKLAVIVAFRDREEHLRIFLHHMHPIFQRQLLDYRIFVIEQAAGEPFNR